MVIWSTDIHPLRRCKLGHKRFPYGVRLYPLYFENRSWVWVSLIVLWRFLFALVSTDSTIVFRLGHVLS